MEFDEEFDERIRRLKIVVMQGLAEGKPEDRLMAFVSTLMSRSTGERRVSVSRSELGTILLAVLHTGYRHPEWLQMIVKDQDWYLKLGPEEETERLLEEVVRDYPSPHWRPEDES